MEGFFSKKETQSKNRPDGKTYSCVSCGRFKDCTNAKIKASGQFKKGILNIGSFPYKIEDRKGAPFQSKYYSKLKQVYKELGIDLERDCLNTYAVKCYNDEYPTGYQVESCRKFLFKLIKEHKPKVIVLLGQIPLQSIIGSRWKKELGKIDKWHGYTIPDQEFESWICPVFSPEQVFESKIGSEYVIWKRDFKRIVDLLSKPFRWYEPPIIETLPENKLHILNTIKNCQIAIDYEATGLKLNAKGHKIICASVAYTPNNAYSFMIPESRKARKPFTDLLQRESVRKIAQNMKYEDNCTHTKLRIPVINWLYDTMLAAHIIDNRPGVTGLKFQNYVHFGIIDYDSEIAPYLKPKKSVSANDFNRIDELLKLPQGPELLLKYCGHDSINTYRLKELTSKEMLGTQGLSSISPIHSDFPNAYRLFHKGTETLARIERNGFHIDMQQLEKQKINLTNRIKRTEQKIYNSPFYKDWAKHSKGLPSLNSGKQLGDYLYKVLKLKPFKLTSGGSGSTDEDSLKLLGIPELDLIVLRSKYLKLRDTFLASIENEQVDGIMHPMFHLNNVITYRGSSSNINFQNFPKRDPMQMKTIRSCVKPSKGNQLFEPDFKGIEVAVSVAYHNDPVMKKYVSDPSTDMHGDMAEQIFKLDKFDKSKKPHSLLRNCAKNGFVFPQFYGDYYKNNAESICRDWVNLPAKKWKGSEGIEIEEGLTLAQHLINSGIKSYQKFEDHLKEIESHFWNERFTVYNDWKEKQWQFYLEHGYVPLKTGFVCQGLMDRKNVGNYPIQGAAFHCLLWTLIHVENEILERGLKTKIIGQIHDAIVFDLYPPELYTINEIVQRIGTIELPKAYKWINVPLVIETEICPINGSWAEKKEWKPDLNRKVFYYYHAESGSLFESYNDIDKTPNPDGCIEQIEKDLFISLSLEEGTYTDINGNKIKVPDLRETDDLPF